MSRLAVDARPSNRVRKTDRFGDLARALGARIRELRQQRNLTLEAAAERADVDLKHWQKIESAEPPVNLTLVSLLRIADGLGVSISELFERGRRSTQRR